MRAFSGYGRWCLVFGVVMGGVGVLSLSAPEVSAQKVDNDKSNQKKVTTFRSNQGTSQSSNRRLIRVGPGIPKKFQNLKIYPIIKVDYRNDAVSELNSVDGITAVGGREAVTNRVVSLAGPTPTGLDCTLDAECSDCNPCTFDTCDDSKCVGGARNGFGCTTDSECEGTCTGGLTPGAVCRDDLDCCGDPNVPNDDGVCTFNPCTLIESPARSQCVNAPITDGVFVPGAECDDALECNGQETCNSTTQECVAGSPLCPATQFCDESTNSCLAPCLTDTECETDGLACTNDICDVKLCVGGTDDGKTCQDDTQCAAPGTCSGGGTGGCILGPPPCGPNGACTEITVCTGDGTTCDPGGLNQCSQPGQGTCTGSGTSCGNGRCCDDVGVPDCAPADFPTCVAAGGRWTATGNACGAFQSGNENLCPIYSSGIAPQGTFGVEVGSVISPLGAPCPSTISSVGDDYQVGDGTGFMDVTIIRFVASVQFNVRFAIAFRDASGTFIEDIFIPQGVNAGISGPSRFAAEFDPPMTVPRKGFLTFSTQTNFGPQGAFSFVSTGGDTGTNGTGPGVDVGTNDPNDMWLNGTHGSNRLGQCSGGLRDGLWCDVSGGGAATCGTGTCNDIPDVFAFEIVAIDNTGDPSGACCDPNGAPCQIALPWDCTQNIGGRFQGSGTKCKVCSNDLNLDCVTAADCGLACVGGANDGQFCVDNFGCPGGTCTGTPTCFPVPSACAAQACCVANPGLVPPISCASDLDCTLAGVSGPCTTGVCGVSPGDCLQVSGSCADDPTIPCSTNADCTAAGAVGPCVNPFSTTNGCPAGTTSNLFGSSCAPNCCDQLTNPDYSGNTCRAAQAVQITVPATTSDPPVSVTVTGNNSGGDFSSFTLGECIGGTAAPQTPCDPTLASDPCADGTLGTGGACTRLCGAGIFSPTGGTRDPGWWQAFSIDKCADVRIDMCCTDIGGAPLRPAWAGLYPECPCSVVLPNEGVEPPIGQGDGTAGFARGGPFCGEDNLWMTFKALPKGVYYYPIYGAPDGTSANPPGATYQFHITVGACRTAACCSPICVGGSNDGLPCNPAGFPTCPGVQSTCVPDGLGGGVCSKGPLDGAKCDLTTGAVDECPGGGICGDVTGDVTGCNAVTELACDTADGFWLQGTDFPKRVCDINSTTPGAECNVDAQCPGGTCVNNPGIVTCTAVGNPPLGPCEVGSCCRGPGDCVDDDGLGGPMTPALCGPAGLNGTFVGGARCLFTNSPCPICTVPQNTDNCQVGNSGFITTGDRVNGAGRKLADSVISRSSTVEQFCFSPAFTNVENGQVVNECSDPDGTVPPPPDDFQIRFFTDVNGLPGQLLHELAPAPIAAKKWRGGNSRVWDYSIVFDPPLGDPTQGTGPPLPIGQPIWVEFSGAGTPGGAGVGCDIFFFLSEDGNGFYLQEADSFSTDQQWSFEDNGGDDLDVAFCIGGPAPPSIEIPPPLVGCCCECDGTPHENMPWGQCVGQTCLLDGTGGSGKDCQADCDPTNPQTAPCTILPLFANATFTAGQTCAQAGCVAQGAGGGCPGAPTVAGEDCANPKIISLTPAQALVQQNFQYNNACSTTDGRVSYGASPGCDTSGANPSAITFENDLWFEYTSTCTGKVQIDLCGDTTGTFDTIAAVFTNGTSRCPNVNELTGQRTQCPPPLDACEGGPRDGLECTGDADCAPGGTCGTGVGKNAIMVGGQCRDILCNPSNTPGTPSIEVFGDKGVCYLIRVGGEPNAAGAGDVGIGVLSLFCKSETCVPSSQPAQQMAGSPAVPDIKNRYLSIQAGDTGASQAIRVTMIDAPPTHASLCGAVRWVGETGKVSTSPGIGFNQPGPFFTVAKLQCSPLFRDWTTAAAGSQDGFIHIGGLDGEFIIPGATYQVDVINSVGCNPADPGSFSPPEIVKTSGVFADICKAGALGPCQNPPDAPGPDVDVLNDVSGENKAFAGKVRNKIQADIEGNDVQGQTVTTLDGLIQITEVKKILSRVPLGPTAPYEFGPSVIPSCPSDPAPGTAVCMP